MESKVIVALDKLSAEKALELSSNLAGLVWGVKVNDLLLSEGVSIISKLKAHTRVFADPKLYDIPNTVSNSVEAIADAGADLITVHASGGKAMMEAALKKKGHSNILAVTALTSLSDEECEATYGELSKNLFSKLAKLAVEAGIDGLVSSPEELEIKPSTNKDLLRVTPGIRPSWYNVNDDQKRINTPKEAISRGASLLVIGRPITEADEPIEAVKKINQELAS